MKLLVQAVRAVSVELAGVVLVCWLLIHVASWGLRSTIGYESPSSWNRPAVRLLTNSPNPVSGMALATGVTRGMLGSKTGG